MSRRPTSPEQDLEILKQAAAGAAERTYLKSLLGPLTMALGLTAVPAGLSYFAAKKDRERHQQDLENSRVQTFAKNPDFQKNVEQFNERFSELAMISPVIAKNPNLAGRLIDKKLSSGFSIDDIHKLTAINLNARGPAAPDVAARAAAGSGLHTFITTFGPQTLADLKQEKATLDQARATEAAQQAATKESYRSRAHDILRDEMKKQSSGIRVSDECLGRMLADRHIMMKTAGVWDTIRGGAQALYSGAKGAMKPGAEAVGKTLLYMAPALALGGGVELVRQVMETKRSKELEDKANSVFASLRKDSDKVKSDHALAQEAFDTLKAFAPTLAARPQVVKTFVEQVVDAGRLPYQQVAEIAEAENKARGIARGDGFLGGVKSTFGTFGIKAPSTKDLREAYPDPWFKAKPGETKKL
jgi:hypothetical protein